MSQIQAPESYAREERPHCCGPENSKGATEPSDRERRVPCDSRFPWPPGFAAAGRPLGFVGRASRCRNWLDSGGPGRTRSFGFSAGGRRPALGSALVSGSAADRQPVLPGEPGQRTRLNDKTFLGRAFRRGSACVRGGVPGGASSRRGRLSFGDEATRLPEGTLDGFSGGGVSSGNTLTAGRGPGA